MRIGGTLRAASRGLAAPPGARLRILEELRGDLEDLEAAYRAEGLSPGEARRRAAALLAPGAEALEALSAVHRPLWVRWRERPPVRGGIWVGAGLAAVALAAVVAALGEAASVADLPLFLVPLAGIGAAALVHAGTKVVRIWILGESEPTRIRAGSGDLLVAAAGAAVATAFGILLDLYVTAGYIRGAPDQEGALVIDWLRRCVVLGAAGIAVSVPCGLGWLFFVRRAAGQERRERVLLSDRLDLVQERAAAPFPSHSATDRRTS